MGHRKPVYRSLHDGVGTDLVQIPSYWNTIDAMPDTAFPNKFLTRVAVDHSRADMNLGPAATAQVDSRASKQQVVRIATILPEKAASNSTRL